MENKTIRPPLPAFTQYARSLSSNAKNSPVTIIIPVYNGYVHLERLTRSIFDKTDEEHDFLFINDASPDYRIGKFLEKIKGKQKNTRIVTYKKNLGFAASVNKAARMTNRDFVILNTDTEVPRNWLSRLLMPLHLDNNTGSVTPTTSNSKLLGVPNPELSTINFLSDYGVDRIDQAISNIELDMRYN